jgi:hypothetical protein
MRLKLKVFKETYPKFYELLLVDFSKHLDDDFLKKHGEGSYMLWSGNRKGTDEKLLSYIFHGKVTGEKYWVNRISLYENSKEDFREESALVMMYAFEFLGFKIPEYITIHLNPVLKAKILYQLYLEKYEPKFLKKKADELLIYNHETKAVRSDEFDEWAEVRDGISNNDTINEINAKIISGLIYSYFDCINDKDFDKMLSLISNEMQKRMDINAELLAETHLYTILIDEVSIVDLFYSTENENTIDVKVSFWEEKYGFNGEKIFNVEITGFDNINYLVKNVEEILASMNLPKKKKNFISLREMLSAEYASIIAAKFDIKLQDLDKYFPRKEIINLPRFIIFKCVKEDDIWKIEQIENMQTEPYNPYKSHVVFH